MLEEEEGRFQCMVYSRKVQRLHRDRQILDHSVDFPARSQSESPLEQRMVLFERLLLCFAMVCHLASLYADYKSY